MNRIKPKTPRNMRKITQNSCREAHYRNIMVGVILLLGVVFMLNFVNAAERFVGTQDRSVNIVEQCFFNGTTCSSNAVCNITIIQPDRDVLVSQKIMTNQDSFHNYTLNRTETNEIGKYEASITCTDQGTSNFNIFNFEITRSGLLPTTSTGIIYLVVIIVSLFVFGLCMLASIKIPWHNLRNEEGHVIHVNNLKFLKVIMIVVTYLVFVWVMFIARAMADNFLFLDGASTFFHMIFMFLFSMAFPLVFASIGFIIILVVNSKKLKEQLQRGMKI